MGTRAATFISVYSGRLASQDPLDAQLGFVWPASLIPEIIAGGRGTCRPTMKASIICSMLLASATPLPKVGSCRAGYASKASWCVPMSNAPVVVPKGVGQCPSTMRQSDNYCIDTKPQC